MDLITLIGHSSTRWMVIQLQDLRVILGTWDQPKEPCPELCMGLHLDTSPKPRPEMRPGAEHLRGVILAPECIPETTSEKIPEM